MAPDLLDYSKFLSSAPDTTRSRAQIYEDRRLQERPTRGRIARTVFEHLPVDRAASDQQGLPSVQSNLASSSGQVPHNEQGHIARNLPPDAALQHTASAFNAPGEPFLVPEIDHEMSEPISIPLPVAEDEVTMADPIDIPSPDPQDDHGDEIDELIFDASNPEFAPAAPSQLQIMNGISKIDKKVDRLEKYVRGKSNRNPRGDEDGGDADDEGTVSGFGERKNRGRVTRETWVVVLQRIMREHTGKLMKREVPSPERVRNFENDVPGSGPSLEYFRLDYQSPPGSKWNARLTAIFVADFMDVHWAECKKYNINKETYKKTLQKKFVSHTRTLRGNVKKEKDTEISRKMRLTKAARSGRRRELYYRRLETVQLHRDMKRHEKALVALGPEGMSSDESGLEDGVPHCYVTNKPWRNPVVRLWLRDIDSVHLSLRVTGNGRIKRGRWPLPRVDFAEESESPPVRGLPINFYNQEWLARRTEEQKDFLEVNETPYPLGHTEAIRQIAMTWKYATKASEAPIAGDSWR